MCDTFGHPLYVSTYFDSIHFDPRHGSCPARIACMDGIDGQISKASRALDCSRSLDKVFPRTPLEMGKKLYWMGNTTIGKAGLTPFLMEHLVEAETRKKRPPSRVFFFLPAFGRCCPSVSAQSFEFLV